MDATHPGLVCRPAVDTTGRSSSRRLRRLRRHDVGWSRIRWTGVPCAGLGRVDLRCARRTAGFRAVDVRDPDQVDAHQRHAHVRVDHDAFVEDQLDDVREAAAARAEKRSPEFKGR